MEAQSYDGALDRGLEGVLACTSQISTIHGSTLLYRGYRIEDLAEHAGFEEVVHLLWEGRLPTRRELDWARGRAAAGPHRCRPRPSAGSTACRRRCTRWTSCTPSWPASRCTIPMRT